MGTKITKQQFEERVHEVHPFSKIQILDYDKIKGPMSYQCLRCGEIYKVKSAGDIFSRLNPCSCHKDFYSREAKIRYFEAKQTAIKVIQVKGDKTFLHCENCGEDFERTTASVMTSFNSCPNCNNRFDKQTLTIAEAENILLKKFPNQKYRILEYQNYKKEAKIECLDCHFVYKGAFSAFLNSRGCPRCYRKQSKGETKIELWLQSKKIDFIKQKPLDQRADTHRYKFDFFLPYYNLAIEYNGEQHYIQKKGRFDKLSVTQQRDKVKEEYCKEMEIKLLVIPYWEYNNIEDILSKRFNDYPAKE